MGRAFYGPMELAPNCHLGVFTQSECNFTSFAGCRSNDDSCCLATSPFVHFTVGQEPQQAPFVLSSSHNRPHNMGQECPKLARHASET